jgi:hypothetical protein
VTTSPYNPHRFETCHAEPYGLPCNKNGHQAANGLLRAGVLPDGAKVASDADLLDLRYFGPKQLSLLRQGQGVNGER